MGLSSPHIHLTTGNAQATSSKFGTALDVDSNANQRMHNIHNPKATGIPRQLHDNDNHGEDDSPNAYHSSDGEDESSQG